MKQTMSILFVCLGNICRSPTAEAVFKSKVAQAGLSDIITSDSAGTAGWHEGSPPDPRTISAAKTRGYDLSDLRGRKVVDNDFKRFDLIYAMDRSNLHHLDTIRNSLLSSPTFLEKTDQEIAKTGLFLNYLDTAIDEVPDPYHGGAEGFERVLDLIEEASDMLVEHVKCQLSNI